MPAQDNPYRNAEANGAENKMGQMMSARIGHITRDSSTANGPGLLGSDLEDIARRHFRDGYALAEKEAEGRERTLKEGQLAGLAKAFDDGFDSADAARVLRVVGEMQRWLDARIVPGLVAVEAANEKAPKSKAAAATPALRQGVDELREELARLHQGIRDEISRTKVYRVGLS